MVTNRNVSTSRWSLQTSIWRTDIRILLICAMSVFLLPVGFSLLLVVIALLSGRYVMTETNRVLDDVLWLTDAGMIGWTTLSVFAISIWVFGEGASQGTNQFIHWSSILAAIFVPLSVLVSVLDFLSRGQIALAVFGIPVLLVMIAFLSWVVARRSKSWRGSSHPSWI